jgi:two-component system, NtrC family, sensor histidine kinase HydH
VQISVVFGFAALAANTKLAEFGGTTLGGGLAGLPASHYYVHASVLAAVTLGVGQISHLLSNAFASSFRRAMSARHELLVSYAERVKELTTLSAEIAHELKNPLASIKGLSGLLTQNVSDERGSERLRVLRREIDRMQSVLEEFLNFSRPLVPLSLKRCDLAELGQEVVALHEGLARQRAVRLACEGLELGVDCDPRKVKQILINLVQNALEATPANGEVSVSVRERGEDAIVEVVDDGSGLPLDLGDVFEPGITSKSGGAGIGLTIARALARQHGGELSLAAREAGGTRAELRLPKHPQVLPGSGVA